MSAWVGLPEADETDDAWFEEHRFAELIKDQGVLGEIARYAPRPGPWPWPWPSGDVRLPSWCAPPGMGAAQMLGIARRVQPSGAEPRMRAGRHWEDEFDAEIGRTIVAVLCSLTRRELLVCDVEQRPDGCTLVIPLPSPRRIFDGTMRIEITSTTGGANVDATVEMPGQLVGWGFGRKTFTALSEDIVEWFETKAGIVR